MTDIVADMMFTSRQTKTAIILCLLTAVLATKSFAAVRIAEFRPALRTQYVELENDSNEAVAIGGWQVDFGLPNTIGTIPLATIIPAHQCILLSTKHLSTTLSTRVSLHTETEELVDSVLFNANLVEGYTYQLFGSSHMSALAQSLGRHNSDGTPCSSSLATSTETITPTLTPAPTSAIVTPSTTPTIHPMPTSTPWPTPTPTTPISPSPTNTPALTTPTTTPTTSTPIILTEVMIAPTSPNPEWIELYNPTDTLVTIDNWAIDDIAGGGSSPQSFSLSLPAHAYRVVELNSAIFNNGGDDVRILDESGMLVGHTTYTKSYTDESWALNTSTQEFCQQEATPNLPSTNTCLHQSTTPSPTATNTPTPKPSSTPSPTIPTVTQALTPTPSLLPTASPSPSATPTPTELPTAREGVYISEFMARPPTGESEWIEFFNTSDQSMNLSGWYIDDVADGGSSPKLISSLTILPHSYVALTISSAILNNDADSVRLLYSDKSLVDELVYEDAESGTSFSRNHVDQTNICKTNPTPGEENDSCLNADEDDSVPIELTDPIATVTPTALQPIVTLTPQPIIAPFSPFTGEIQGVSTYRPLATDSSALTATSAPTPDHTSSKIALAAASILSSCGAILLFLKKIRPW